MGHSSANIIIELLQWDSDINGINAPKFDHLT